MTRKLFLSLILILIAIQTKAHCIDCSKKDTVWKFAAGVTLYSNNLYVYNENLLERQPFEFNFRYKLAPNHILRLSTPIAWKVKLTRDPSSTIPNYEFDESLDNKALAYYIAMKHDEVYSHFYKSKESYYNLLGGCVGYDYNMNFGSGISVAAGLDLSYCYYKSTEKFYGIGYSIPDENNVTNVEFVDYTERTNEWKAFVAKPQICLRYQFQKLLLEGGIGYAFTISNLFAEMKSQSDGSNENYYGTSNRNYDFKKMIFQLSLFYTL